MGLLDDLEAAERAASLGGTWARGGLRDAMVVDGYSPQDAAYADLACRLAPALLRVARAAQYRDGCAEGCVAMTPYRGCTCGHVELAAALAALEGGRDGE